MDAAFYLSQTLPDFISWINNQLRFETPVPFSLIIPPVWKKVHLKSTIGRIPPAWCITIIRILYIVEYASKITRIVIIKFRGNINI